jgi:8-oxo-dGTP pyrophosphatase MutT (NUDIX family)
MVNGQFLMQQRAVDRWFPLTWELPGGKVELDETHENALVREWREELGLRCTLLGADPLIQPSFVVEFDVPDVHQACRISFYRVRILWSTMPGNEPPGVQRPGFVRSLDGVGHGWFSPREAVGLNLTPGTLAFISDLNRLSIECPADYRTFVKAFDHG